MTIAILASWNPSKMDHDIYIPNTHYTYLKFVASLYEKVVLISPQKEVNHLPNGVRLELENVDIEPLPYNGSYLGALKNFRAYKTVLSDICKNVDLVYCRVPDPFSWMPSLLYKKKCIMHFVGDTIDATKHNEKWGWIKKKLMLAGYMPEYWLTLKAARRSAVYTNGPHIAKKLEDKGIKATPVISSTVFKNDLHDDFTPLPINNGKVIITYVGYVRFAKGMNCLMDFCRMLRDNEIDFHFNLIGNGEMIDEVRGFVQKESLQNFVTLYGHIDDKTKMNRILRESDLFFFPSLSEGSPRVIIEAMAQGVPVMSTPVGSLPGTFLEGVTIRFFGYNDATKAVDIVKEYIKDVSPFEQQRCNAFKKVAEEITVEKFLSKVFVYET